MGVFAFIFIEINLMFSLHKTNNEGLPWFPLLEIIC